MDKMISDQQQMLDALSSEYEEWMNARLDNEDELLRQIQDKLGENGDINSTLKEISDKYGVSMSDSLKTAIVDGKPFDNVVTAINNLIDKITGLVGVDSNSDRSSNISTDNTKPTTNTDVKQPTANNTNQPSQPIDTQSKPESDGIFIPQKSVYPKNKLDKEKSVVDRLKYFDFASDFQSRATYYKKLGGTGTYTGSASQNKWLINKMKEVGYAKGTNYAKKGLHWTQEEGDEIIIRKSDGAVLTPFNWGDKVVNAEGTNNLFDFANDPQGFLEKFGVMNYAMPAVNVKVPDVSAFKRNNTSPCVNLGGVHIAQVVTNDAQDFMKQLPFVIANDTKTQKVISEVVLGGALGHNSMNARRLV